MQVIQGVVCRTPVVVVHACAKGRSWHPFFRIREAGDETFQRFEADHQHAVTAIRLLSRMRAPMSQYGVNAANRVTQGNAQPQFIIVHAG